MDRLLAVSQDAEAKIDVRQASTEALGTVLLAGQDHRLLEALVPLARGEGEKRVPYAVQMAAGQGIARFARGSQDPEVVALAWDLARDTDVDEGVRTELAEALGWMEDPAEAAVLSWPTCQRPLCPADP